jgi:LPS-assembly protein
MRLPPRGGFGSGFAPVATWGVRHAGRAILPACALAIALGAPAPALAQQGILESIQARQAAQAREAGRGQMLLQADQLTYDNDRQVVVAEGSVQIFYNGTTVLAQRVRYAQQTRRLTAEGRVRITDINGNIYHAEAADLTDDLRDGFVRTLRLERVEDRTNFSADSAERQPGDVTVFNRGTYTACQVCNADPEKPPLWQVRAARIIHKEQERTIYYEDAALEFWGIPVAYLPYAWGPDGSVRRMSGFLNPAFIRNSRVGTGAGWSYYLALSPFYDLTITPVWTTQQGLHVTADWRHALPNGSYRIRFSGINQTNPGHLGAGRPTTAGLPFDPGDRVWRGAIESWGEFRLSERWRFGWSAAVDSDIRYFRDYGLMRPDVVSRTSEIYLAGVGARSYFDARAYHFRTFNDLANDRQALMPWVLPSIDHATVFADPMLGGELTLRSNLASIHRTDGFAYRFNTPAGGTTGYLTPGVAGSYTRATTELTWRRTFTDPIGQRWTPFARLRGDVYDLNPSARRFATLDVNGNTAFPATGGAALFDATDIVPEVFRGPRNAGRFMPTAGMDYRYPFVAATREGSHVIEPIAQIILRPRETRIGNLPNEDAQSLVLDDTNLFAFDKFSGFDRVEGGSRANLGVQYTFQSAGGFLASALFGQSFQLGGFNSFAEGFRDTARAGLDSGLETRRSDYVARLHVQPWTYADVTTRVRFDEQSFRLRRADVASNWNFGRVSASVGYTFVGSQPNLALVSDRSEVFGSLSLRVTDAWSVYGAGRYSLSNTRDNPGWISNQIGVRYTDCCLTFSIDYANVYQGFGSVTPHQRITARLVLRTLGDVTVGTEIGAR